MPNKEVTLMSDLDAVSGCLLYILNKVAALILNNCCIWVKTATVI